MSRPSLPLPSAADGGPRVHGTLLVRTGCDDRTWADVLARMGALPGLVVPDPDGRVPAGVPADGPPRRLLVVDDPAWHGAGEEEVREALAGDRAWVPDLVLLAQERTAAEPGPRPLLAFRPSAGTGFWISPRQAAMVHLILHRTITDLVFEDFEEYAAAPPGGGADDLPDPAGGFLEAMDPAPRYEAPARPLPALTPGNDALLVRTDFSDDAAWAALVELVRHPGEEGFGDIVDDFGDNIDFVDDPAFGGASPEQLMAAVLSGPEETDLSANLVLIGDAAAMSGPDRSLAGISLLEGPGCPFRVPAVIAGIMVVNLALANMDLDDYVDVPPRDLVLPW
ncbi:hypothetical protein SAMN05421803_103452 [Nocardiopsis flavescens]|uniref:DUF6924 domain-containing protein n=1 Tax=Nocardiopsis flavescens TaxID=758803 RepID=A0A1M6GLA3_9ACTN|nr:hypothetical protein [Nocardiopsis flavescens]SHJ10722.1 hypothetical protein SAMN05421803_103452 [Nocardiopsis flavescens]